MDASSRSLRPAHLRSAKLEGRATSAVFDSPEDDVSEEAVVIGGVSPGQESDRRVSSQARQIFGVPGRTETLSDGATEGRLFSPRGAWSTRIGVALPLHGLKLVHFLEADDAVDSSSTRIDPDLAPGGYAEAMRFTTAAQADGVRVKLQAVFVSPLRRALCMAQAAIDVLFRGSTTCPPVYVVDALREQFSGRPTDERRPVSVLQREHPRFDATTHVRSEVDLLAAVGCLETDAELSARCVEVLQLLRRCSLPRVLVVTHRRMLRHLFSAHSGLQVSPGPVLQFVSQATTPQPGYTCNTFGIRGFLGVALGGWTTEFDDVGRRTSVAARSLADGPADRVATLGFALPFDSFHVVHFACSGAAATTSLAGDDSLHCDAPLLPEGIAQASRFAALALRNGTQLQAVFVSPFRRALQTAQGIVNGMFQDSATGPPVFVVDALREQYSGRPTDERRPVSVLQREHPRFDTKTHVRSEVDPWAAAGRLETAAELSARCVEVLQLLRSSPYPRVLVVSHERILRHLLAESDLHVVPPPPQTREAAAAISAADGLAPEFIRPFESCEVRSFAVGGWLSSRVAV